MPTLTIEYRMDDKCFSLTLTFANGVTQTYFLPFEVAAKLSLGVNNIKENKDVVMTLQTVSVD